MSTVNTMTLTEFLLARIAEDEEAARSRADGRTPIARVMAGLDYPPTPALYTALRAVVELHTEDCWQFGDPIPTRQPKMSRESELTLCELASIWAGHPDYREEWRQ